MAVKPLLVLLFAMGLANGAYRYRFVHFSTFKHVLGGKISQAVVLAAARLYELHVHL